jgi:hypothetical protein
MSSKSSERAAARAVAMVLLREPRIPDGDAVLAALPARRRATLAHVGATTLTLELDGEASMVGLMPAPIAWSQLAGPCATAWWWPDAEAACRQSTAHLIAMTSAASGDVFEANLRLTDLVAALASTADALAVYWGAGTLVHEPGAFRAEAATASRALLPLRLWIDFRIVPLESGKVFLATSGLKTFGLMEIECVGGDAPRLLDRAFNAAHYLCDRGPVLEDGNTFGLTATERVPVSHRPSRLKRDEKVIYLEFPG